jgi:hypothetical protein
MRECAAFWLAAGHAERPGWPHDPQALRERLHNDGPRDATGTDAAAVGFSFRLCINS